MEVGGVQVSSAHIVIMISSTHCQIWAEQGLVAIKKSGPKWAWRAPGIQVTREKSMGHRQISSWFFKANKNLESTVQKIQEAQCG